MNPMILKVQNERDEQGVRLRMDGGGDEWAAAHRKHAGRDCYMQDVDGLFGFSMYAHNTADKLWLEYIPDNYRNKTNVIRNFALVGVFDRKRSWEVAFNERSTLSRSVYLWLCRTVAERQPTPPRFFYVIGATAPWQMVEVNITSGVKVGDAMTLNGEGWEAMFKTLGIDQLRATLRDWIDPRSW